MTESVVFQGFTVVPVKLEESSECTRYFYVKEHSVRDTHACKPKGRTLFVLNVPPYCEQKQLRTMFGCCGDIDSVHIQSKPSSGPPPVNQSNFFPSAPLVTGYKVAYIVFRKELGVKKAKALPYHKPLLIQSEKCPHINTGMEKWCREYRADVMDKGALQKDIDQYMHIYDKKIDQERKQAKANEGVPDEDGWITVSKYGKNKGAPRTEAHEKALTKKEKKKRKDKELLNFYSFQVRETKRDQIANLRKKFEEDKQRIALMKESRKFRPY